MGEALARHDAILRQAVMSQGGYVVKTTGDGIHAAFETADAAVAAAVEGQRALAAEPWHGVPPLRVRMGMHTGAAELRDGDYFGPALNRAARLMSAADGGQVVLSSTTEELVRDSLPATAGLRDLGEHRLRDLGRADRVFQVDVVGLPDQFPPLRSLDAFPGNLPVQLTSFVGRDAELRVLAEAVQAARLVTLTGVGGVGKTRLAIQLAAELLPEFPGGAWLCELAAAEDAESMSQLVAATLGVQPKPGASLLESIVSFLQPKALLVILDNCEHVIDAAGRLAEGVVGRCPDVRIVATSREGLAVAGEQVWPLRTLQVPDPSLAPEEIAADDSVLLFADRARASRPGFSLEATNAAAVAEICRRLDGMPLAIELAAARVVSMSPREIAQRLDERFRLLTGGRRTAVERHQTLRATLDWSYSLLDARDRQVFDRLGVFVGGFDADALDAVTASEGVQQWDTIDALGDLVTKSLVSTEERPDGTTRYEVLETIRHYARERLDEAGDADAWRRRHAVYFADLAEKVGPGLRGPDELVWRTRLAVELDNLRAAVGWALDASSDADTHLALRIIAALAPQSTFDPSLGVGAWAARALDRLDAASPAQYRAVLAAAAFSVLDSGNVEHARDLAQAALDAEIPTDAPWVALPTIAMFQIETHTGRQDPALSLYVDALRDLGDRLDPIEAITLHGSLAGTVGWLGDVEGARDHGERALAIARTISNPSALSSALFCYAIGRRYTDPTGAQVALEECVTQLRAGATPVMKAYAVAALAQLRARAGEREGALEDLLAALRYAAGLGAEYLLRWACGAGVEVLVELGAMEPAAEFLGMAGPVAAQLPTEGPDGSDAAAWGALRHRLKTALGPEGSAAGLAHGAARPYHDVVPYIEATLGQLLLESTDEPT